MNSIVAHSPLRTVGAGQGGRGQPRYLLDGGMSGSPFEIAVRMWWRGYSLEAIAVRLGCTRARVKALLFARRP
jgi:hypothetical protein